MNRSNENYNVRVKIIFKILKIVGILIPFENIKTGLHTSLNYRIYSTIIFFILNGISITCWCCRMYFNYPENDITVILTDFLESLSGTILYSSCFINTVSKCQENRITFSLTMEEVQSRFTNLVKRKSLKIFEIEMILQYIFLFVACTVFLVTWTSLFEFKDEKFIIIKEVVLYISIISVYQMYFFNLQIKYYLRIINKILKKRLENVNVKDNLTEKLNTDEIIIYYDKLSNLIDTANSIYGFSTLSLITFISVRIVATINLSFIVYKAPAAIIAAIIWTLIVMVFCTLLVISCESVIDESKRTAIIGYKLLLKLPLRLTSIKEKQEYEKLHYLIQQVHIRNVEYSAAGFFTLNCSTLLALFSTVASYSVVVLTLHIST